MFCNRCGAKMEERDAYCHCCGVGVPTGTPGLTFSAAPVALTCPSCGAEHKFPGRYCVQCGVTLDLTSRVSVLSASQNEIPQGFFSGKTWLSGTIGAALAAAGVWIAALILKMTYFRRAVAALDDVIWRLPGVDVDRLKPGVGLIYGFLHQANLALELGEKGNRARDAAEIGLTMHMPFLLGLIIAGTALYFAGRYLRKSASGEEPGVAALRIGLSVAFPYALISVIIGWIGGSSLDVVSFGVERTVAWGPALGSLFMNAFGMALIFATLGAYRPTGGQPSAGSLSYWMPAYRTAMRAVAGGLVLTFVVSLSLGFFGARAQGMRSPKLGHIQEQMLPLKLGPASELEKTGEVLLVGLPIAITDAHGLSHFATLSVKDQVRDREGNTTGDKAESVSLLKLPKGSKRFWVLALVPLVVLPAAGLRAVRRVAAKGAQAIIYGVATGAVYAVLLALLVHLAQVSLDVSGLGGKFGAAVGAGFGSVFWPTLLVSVILAGVGGFLGGRASGTEA